MTRHVRWIVVALLVAGCGTGGPATPSATAVPASAPASGATFQLQHAPANMGCDSIGVDYREVTFHIDPAADDPVIATADTGRDLSTFWSAGFQGSATDKTVSDPGGAVVVTDGQVLLIPEGAYPRLGGYFVCLAPDALYILLDDPA